MSAENNSRQRGSPVADLRSEERDDQPDGETPVPSSSTSRPLQAHAEAVSTRSPDADMVHLRRLLLGEEYTQLAEMRADIKRLLRLEETLSDPVRQTDHVSRVLSEAMLRRENQDQGVSKALRPALSDAIKAAVRKNPQPVVEAVSPVIGPAIRRAVNDAIAGMLELLDKLLEHSLSWQSLKWRFEAWRTGRRYSELVLLRTLIYRVEQVLLIHHETGLLLEHVESPQSGVRDPDLVGSMLTAINDFVGDSFSTNEESLVQTIQVGDHKVIVEQGRFAVIAAIARGNPPSELARTVRETLETIEILYGDALESFDGDATPYSQTRPLLEDCLKSQQRAPATRRRWLAPALIGLFLLMALGYWSFSSYRTDGLWSTALNALRAEPGFAITDASRDGGVYRVHGLRDPLAREPEAVVGPEPLSALQWEWHWRPYLSTEPEFLLARARQRLQPPSTVTLSLDGSVLELSGEAPQPWIDTLRTEAPRIPGISDYRVDALRAIADADRTHELWSAALEALRAEPGIVLTEVSRQGSSARVHGLRDPLAREPGAVIGPEAASILRWDWHWRPFLSTEEEFLLARARRVLQPPPTVELSLQGGVLHLAGEAPEQWVDTLHLEVRGIPGVSEYKDDDLRAIDDAAGHREALAHYRQEIEATMLYFDVNAVRIDPAQQNRLETLGGVMKALVAIAAELDLRPGFLVTGYSDTTGSLAQNRRLSSLRASNVITALIAEGVGEHLFLPLKISIASPDEVTETSEQRARNRRVSVEVILRGEEGASAKR